MKRVPLAILIAVWLLWWSGPVVNAAGQQLHGHVPGAVPSLTADGVLPATNQLRLAISLPLRNQAALSALLRDIYDPASTNFHHYLTPAEFTQRFGPAEQDYEAVAAFAGTHHLRVTTRHPNRVILDVAGSAADIQQTLHVSLRTYRHPTENRSFYAPDAEPSLDLAVPILHISGLDNYSLPRPGWVARPQANWPKDQPNAGTGPNGAYLGKDFRNAYAPSVTLTGAGQVVGLFQLDGYTTSDITYYETLAGLSNVTLTNILLDGASGLPSGTGGEVEVSLDIEMAISMAPGLAQVMVYEAPNPSPFEDILNRMVTDNLAKQLSCSWFIPNGPADPAAEIIFQEMIAQGQSFYAASGDSDAFTGLIPFPGDSTNITQVGGTTLATGTAGVWSAEIVWNTGSGSGSGGGISTQYAIPSWQAGVNMITNLGSTNMRNTPDVALTADNVYVRADGVDQTVGGTSCAAPLWAGFTALVNQQASNFSRPPIGFINPAVYAIGAGTNYTAAFHDITTGNNTNSGSPTRFYAVPGYDLCTGWGTPTGQGLIDALEPPLMVTLPASATEGDGVLAGAGHVILPRTQPGTTVVLLTSSDQAQVQVPASINIPAGLTNGAFDLTILDDGILDGTQVATITATTANFGASSASMNVFDKESAQLQAVLPATVSKDQGAVAGTVQMSGVAGANVTVTLNSDTTNLVQVPSTVLIPSGRSNAAFNATVLTDGKINGGQTVHITAHVQDWLDGTTNVAVQDDLQLTVTLPQAAWENAGVLTNVGTVGLAGTASVDESISLFSGDILKLTVPTFVTIPAGSLSAKFNLAMIDNSVADGNQLIGVTAAASGFSNGTASMLVLDDETPLAPNNPAPANLAANVSQTTGLAWSLNSNFLGGQLLLNGGFESGSLTNWTVVPSPFATFVIDNGSVLPPSGDAATPPFQGGYCALGEATGPGIFYLYQTVSIPSTSQTAKLSWAHRIRNFYSSFNSQQQFQVRICDTNENVLATAYTTMPGDTQLGDWVQTNYDLSAFAGQTINVVFWVDPGDYYLDVAVDSVSVVAGVPGGETSVGVTNAVYFGTNPTPGPAQYQGSTTNFNWSLPSLAPLTTYYWQIVTERGGTNAGPVWQFTTAGVDHFAWSPISSPQVSSQPFGVTVTGQDVFNNTVSNFNGTAALQCASTNLSPRTVEDFESGVWPHAPWVSVAGVTLGTLSPGYAHDGNYGLSDPEWIYRTDVSLGRAGESLSWWTRISTSGRSYLGFSATSNGCWSIVAAQNTSQFILQQNSGYQFSQIAAVNQNWVAGRWYKVTVQFMSSTSVTCNLYDSDGTTLLNSLTYTGVTGLPGGVAMRSIGAFALDTIVSVGVGSNLLMTPIQTGSFSGGVWSGTVTVLQTAANVALRASDTNGHTGLGNAFNVILANDVSISVVATPNPVAPGSNLTCTITVTNTGPLPATSLTVSDALPANVAFVLGNSPLGPLLPAGNLVTAGFGTVPGGSSATATIVVVPLAAGVTITNTMVVARGEADANPANNTNTVLTTVGPPAMGIADASLVEPGAGISNLFLPVNLSVPSGQIITVSYATSDGSALAGQDYVATNGSLVFPPGATSQSVAVSIKGSIAVGPNKTFQVILSNAANATFSRSQATGTIVNQNGLPGQVYRFSWNPIGSPEVAGLPFMATINALDYSNNPATNFNGTATLTATNGGGAHVPLAPVNTGNFTNGLWIGALHSPLFATNEAVTANDGNGHTGVSNPFNVGGLPTLSATLNSNAVILAWPASPAGFVLQTSPSLSPAAWSAAGGTPVQTGGTNSLSVPPSGTNAFYRLQFQGP